MKFKNVALLAMAIFVLAIAIFLFTSQLVFELISAELGDVKNQLKLGAAGVKLLFPCFHCLNTGNIMLLR